MALKSTVTVPPVIEGVTQVNSNGDTIIANPVVLVDPQGEFTTIPSLSNGKIPVEVSSLPLPTGAATSTNQSTANTSLASIDGKIPTLVNGRLPVDVPGSGSAQGLAYLSTATITRAANTTPNE